MQLIDGDSEILRNPLPYIEELDMEELTDLADYMYALVEMKGGAGLSANQIGLDRRMFVINYKDYKQTFINPKIEWLSDEFIMLEEGCLTYPGIFMNVKRPTGCRLSYTDYEGKYHERSLFTGLSNRIILHEYDHMEGQFFYDHLSNVQKQRFWKKVKKSEKKVA